MLLYCNVAMWAELLIARLPGAVVLSCCNVVMNIAMLAELLISRLSEAVML